MKPSDFTVGQSVVAVYSLNRKTPEIRPSTVTAIGRKWVTFEYGDQYRYTDRFDPEDMRIAAGNFSSPGRAYLSVEDYEAETALSAAWSAVKWAMHGAYRRPDGMTAERMAEFLKGFDDA